jgi:hypothetical protein
MVGVIRWSTSGEIKQYCFCYVGNLGMTIDNSRVICELLLC